MEFSDHTTIAILRVAWVIDFGAFLLMNWAALALLRYGDAHPAALGSTAGDLPGPGSRSWLWRTAGGGRLLRFAWFGDAIRAQDSTVRRYALVVRIASAVIAASLITMLLVTVRHPSRHWDIVFGTSASSPAGSIRAAHARPLLLPCDHPFGQDALTG